MRQVFMAAALFAAACSPVAPQSADAQPQASIEACVAAATTHEGLWQCKGVVSTPCTNKPDGESTMGMIECFGREGEAWQALLDAHIARLNADDPSRSERLARSSTAWAAWREAECAYQASEAEGGSLAGVIANSCHSDLTADRVIALTWAERAVAQ